MAGRSRVKRQKPWKTFKRHNYRSALKYLLEDFDNRCAYSMMHQADGSAPMEVDHFDPTLPEEFRHHYTNLLPAIRHCNGKKSDHWPTARQRKLGIRFIDPTRECDYGEQIFENPETHLLEGTTPAAIYHIRYLDLNADFFIQRRRERAAFRRMLDSPAFYKADWDQALLAQMTLETVKDFIKRGIPPIPAPPPKKE